MLLQLIVSQYKNGDAQIKRFLDSVELQQDIDFNEVEALIVNDGDFVILSEEFQNSFKNYSFKIRYEIKPWGGISSVRRYGQERTTADYIMFCDGDDLFLRNNALWDYFNIAKTKQPDIITAKFVTDMSHIDKDGKIVADYFRDYNLENVWIHGKMFKMSFLTENNIKWHDELEIYEDSYYVRLCFALTSNKVNIDNATYFWKFTKGTLTRSDEHWTTHTYCDKVRSNEVLVEELTARNMKDAASNFVWAQTYEFYYTLNSPEASDPKFADSYLAIEKKYLEYFSKYNEYLSLVTTVAEEAMIEVMVRRFYTETNIMTHLPVSNGKVNYKQYNLEAKTLMYNFVTELFKKHYNIDK